MSGAERKLEDILAEIDALMRRARANANGTRGLTVAEFMLAKYARAAAEVECRRLDEAEARALRGGGEGD